MGNRATVIFTDGQSRFSPAIYLHWNGGPESVYAFLDELNRRKIGADQDYEAARFIQLVGEFFDHDTQGGHSLGVVNGPASDSIDDLRGVRTDHGDNGFYLVNRTGGKTVMRRLTERVENTAHPDVNMWRIVLTEWTPAQVALEERTARESDYIPGIAEVFAKIAGGRKVSPY